jgi:hypothetical protein
MSNELDGGCIGGGAIYVGDMCSVVLEDCQFVLNQAGGGAGGAVFVGNSRAQITRCTFKKNVGGAQGGALVLHNGTAEITDCIFDSNSAQQVGTQGGAMAVVAGKAVLKNCTFYRNQASCNPGQFAGEGGAIAVMTGGTLLSTDCIFSENDGCTNGVTASSSVTKVRTPRLSSRVARSMTARPAQAATISNEQTIIRK